ncbi:conjugative transfer signal peptidase TraF [Neorhizobium sp. NCHU2750]|uniref:conjugative transfer signal peptidase TraF n=1 Tax=Neorhizobium sp. NCHU2750 TaxID=1825976 RepID=UPI000E747416|nr:conjugal transfer protein [Neorhizobium sp. NCHU2750]
MNPAPSDARKITRRSRGPARILTAAAIVGAGTFLAGLYGGLRINTTASEPLGIWRIMPLDRPAARGDLVFVCLPENADSAVGKSRGYLRPGLCPDGVGPLIKTVVAVAGEKITVGGSVTIDGIALADSRVVEIDGRGRPLVPYAGGVVPYGQVFLHSPFAGSWDSRYFGPLPASGILGLAREVLTYDP